MTAAFCGVLGVSRKEKLAGGMADVLCMACGIAMALLRGRLIALLCMESEEREPINGFLFALAVRCSSRYKSYVTDRSKSPTHLYSRHNLLT